MTKSKETAGYFNSGLPYNRFGDGARNRVVVQGLVFENKPLTGFNPQLTTSMYKFLADDYTVYLVNRRPGLSEDVSMKDMADDYATMIREEFEGAVDVIGTSTGGSFVQHLAADHPDVVRRLVIHSSASRLTDEFKQGQLRIAELARQRKWRTAYSEIFTAMMPPGGVMKYLAPPLAWLGSLFAIVMLGVPDDSSDLIATIEAHVVHDFKDRLSEIKAPTLVIAHDKDPFYPEALVRETAAGLPNGKLILYEGRRHPSAGKQFSQDVLTFLRENIEEDT